MTHLGLAHLLAPAARLLRAALTFAERARARRAFRRLDDHLLRDIGMTRHEADTLSRQPVWTETWAAPPHWHQPPERWHKHGQGRANDCAIPARGA